VWKCRCERRDPLRQSDDIAGRNPRWYLGAVMKYADRLFDAFMYPLEAVALNRRRRALMQHARGTVLEIGAGTGANLPFYRWDRIEHLHITDVELTDRVRAFSGHGEAQIFHHQADVQFLPFTDEFFDTVVFSLVFCSVPDPARGLAEVRRVLKPNGTLIFIEHVRPSGGVLRRVVDIANPAWNAFTRECNINRDTLPAIKSAGFAIESVRHGGRGLLVDGVARRL
jgi:SAM-dependent methyltransferase